MTLNVPAHRSSFGYLACFAILGSSACDSLASREVPSDAEVDLSSIDYCEPTPIVSDVLAVRPAEGEPAIDDVNWFARPVPHDGPERLIAFASHDQNYLYDLDSGAKIRIPDRSDAVATPDGRYMTVPSYYTPDSNVRFYPVAPMLEHLTEGRDADALEPVFIHEHPAMSRVYYQSTGIVSEETSADEHTITYRLMFSGTGDESGFRIVDYRFVHDPASGVLQGVSATDPMRLCPSVTNDLNTPFISKDARFVAAYTSEFEEPGYAPGASLKVFQITGTDPANGTTTCEELLDLGFAAGKADFSFDGSMLTFHLSQGAYLTPFVNGGLPEGTITDIATARFVLDQDGVPTDVTGLQRLTTSLESGVGSYFPAFFPDGSLFYIANAVPRESGAEKRFHFRVVDPADAPWGPPTRPEHATGWETIASLWESSCTATHAQLTHDPFPLDAHEAVWTGRALSQAQCTALVEDAAPSADAEGLLALCSTLGD